MMSQSIQGRETADAYEIDFVDDKTGNCEFTLKIPHTLSEKWAETFARRRLEIAQAELENGTLYHVPKSVRSNIQKIIESTTKLTLEYYGLVEPMIDGLKSIVMKEMDLINTCNDFRKEPIAKAKELAGKYQATIQDHYDKLGDLKTAYREINYNLVPRIELLQKRLQQLTDQIAKVDEAKSPKAYEQYMRLYDAEKAGVETCAKYQQEIPSWKDTEAKAHAIAMSKIAGISKPKDNPKADQPLQESKGSEIRLSSPARISSVSSNDSKDDSPNHSPSNGLVRSTDASSSIKGDSPPLFPIPAANIKFASLPQVMHGTNSQAVQQQKQTLAIQNQQTQPPVRSANSDYSASK
jgi:hypothetical protein